MSVSSPFILPSSPPVHWFYRGDNYSNAGVVDGRYTLGFYTPPQVAARAEGDCDSKSLFFATLWNGGAREVILVQVPKHLFLGVRGLHATSHKQTVVQVGGVDYLLCESTAEGWAPGEISEDCRRHLREGRATFLSLS